MLLSDLVAILSDEVPQSGGVPTSAQYEQAIKDAVTDFSRRCGREKLATLNIVSGTATYDLPADFLTLIMLESFSSLDGVIVSSAGIIPLEREWNEEYTIRNRQITFFPTPTYNMARDFAYKAAWVLTTADEDYGVQEYATLTDDEAQIVLLKAQGIAISKKASALQGSTMSYSLGAVKVDKGGAVENYTKQEYALHGEYVQACNQYNGASLLGGE